MLVLSGDIDETFVVNFGTSRECEILVINVQGGRVQLGFTAPAGVQIHRGKVAERIRREKARNGGRP